MTTSRRRTTRPRSGQRRSTPTTWWNDQSVNNLLGSGVSARFPLLDPASATLPATFEAGVTVVRMILRVIIRSASQNQYNFGGYAVLVKTGTAVIDVILGLFDYYLHQNWSTITGASLEDSSNFYQRDYDIRTARRLRGMDRRLEFMVTNNSAGAGSIRWDVSARLLLKA